MALISARSGQSASPLGSGAVSSPYANAERFHLGDGVFYLHTPEGAGRSKLVANSERLLGVPMTGRNWRTVCRILELAEEASSDCA